MKAMEKEQLRREWIDRMQLGAHLDKSMDFIIFRDNYLFGEDDIPKLKEALQMNQ